MEMSCDVTIWYLGLILGFLLGYGQQPWYVGVKKSLTRLTPDVGPFLRVVFWGTVLQFFRQTLVDGFYGCSCWRAWVSGFRKRDRWTIQSTSDIFWQTCGILWPTINHGRFIAAGLYLWVLWWRGPQTFCVEAAGCFWMFLVLFPHQKWVFQWVESTKIGVQSMRAIGFELRAMVWHADGSMPIEWTVEMTGSTCINNCFGVTTPEYHRFSTISGQLGINLVSMTNNK